MVAPTMTARRGVLPAARTDLVWPVTPSNAVRGADPPLQATISFRLTLLINTFQRALLAGHLPEWLFYAAVTGTVFRLSVARDTR